MSAVFIHVLGIIRFNEFTQYIKTILFTGTNNSIQLDCISIKSCYSGWRTSGNVVINLP